MPLEVGCCEFCRSLTHNHSKKRRVVFVYNPFFKFCIRVLDISIGMSGSYGKSLKFPNKWVIESHVSRWDQLLCSSRWIQRFQIQLKYLSWSAFIISSQSRSQKNWGLTILLIRFEHTLNVWNLKTFRGYLELRNLFPSWLTKMVWSRPCNWQIIAGILQ